VSCLVRVYCDPHRVGQRLMSFELVMGVFSATTHRSLPCMAARAYEKFADLMGRPLPTTLAEHLPEAQSRTRPQFVTESAIAVK
jgi:hypothetical protein